MRKSRIAVPVALTLAIALPAAALASSEEIDHLKRENAEMKQLLMQMQEQLQEVMMKTNAMEQQAKEAAESADKKGGMVKSKKEGITLSTTGGGIKVKSSKGNEFKIGTMQQFDHDSYDDFWGDDAEENKIRRSRISLSGKSGKHWSYKFTANIDHEGSSDWIDTGFLKYTGKPLYLRVGKYKRPGMLEARTSGNWIVTIERSIVNELASAFLAKPRFGGIEVGFGTKGDMPMSGSIGVFDNELEESDGDDIYGIGGRFSIMPKFGDNSFLHAGASFYTVDYKGNNYRMRSRMGVNNISYRPFETHQHKTDDIDQFGVELAYVNGPFSLQGEFMNVESDGTNNAACGASGTYTPGDSTANAYLEDSDENRLSLTEFASTYDSGQAPWETDDDTTTTDIQTYLNSLEDGDSLRGHTVVNPRTAKYSGDPDNTCDLEMDGFYVQAAYTLTGETRGYKAGSGAFTGIKPKGKGGAWELIARYEDADVDVPGRSLSADLERLVLGVNWYANRNVKFMLNYMDSEVDGCSKTARTFDVASDAPQGTAVPDGHDKTFGIKRCNNDDGNAISLRGQYTF